MGSPGGFWTAVSGAAAQSQKLDVVANNIANTDTVGFKKDEALFEQYLTEEKRPDDGIVDIPRTIFRDSDFYHTGGKENTMVNLNKIYTHHSQGHLKGTQNPYDLAIEGKGYFPIQTPQGLGFTRSGEFKVNNEGQLVTSQGFPLLVSSGPVDEPQPEVSPSPQNAAPGVVVNPSMLGSNKPVDNIFVATKSKLDSTLAVNNTRPLNGDSGRSPASVETTNTSNPGGGTVLEPLVLPQGESRVLVKDDGRIYAGSDLIGALALADFKHPENLKKSAGQIFIWEASSGSGMPQVTKDNKIHQGFLEMSNVNPTAEIVELIKANRNFESNMRAMRTYNDMASKEANEVGKL